MPVELTKAQRISVEKLGFVPEPGTYRVGPHVLVVGDLEDPETLDALLRHGPWDLAWTDPPWNPGLTSTFRRNAGHDDAGDLRALFDRLGEVLGWVTHVAAVWTGLEARPLAIRALEKAGFQDLKEFGVTYGRHPNSTPVSVGMREPRDGLELNGLHGGKAIADAFLAWFDRPLVKLVDPFAGQDVAARAASGNVVLTGCELHPGRAATTLARLAKTTRQKPERML